MEQDRGYGYNTCNRKQMLPMKLLKDFDVFIKLHDYDIEYTQFKNLRICFVMQPEFVSRSRSRYKRKTFQ